MKKPYTFRLEENLKKELQEIGAKENKTVSKLLHEGGWNLVADAINDLEYPSDAKLKEMVKFLGRETAKLKTLLK